MIRKTWMSEDISKLDAQQKVQWVLEMVSKKLSWSFEWSIYLLERSHREDVVRMSPRS